MLVLKGVCEMRHLGFRLRVIFTKISLKHTEKNINRGKKRQFYDLNNDVFPSIFTTFSEHV